MVSRGSARFVVRLWWTVALLLAFFSFLVGHSVYTSWHQHEEQAVVETYSVARVLESDLAGLFDKVKLALHTVATERERQLAWKAPGDEALRTYAANIDALLPDVQGFLVSDADGRIVVSRAFSTEPVVSIAEAPYFARLRDLFLSGFVISPPHHDHFGSQEEIDVVRRVEHPDGRFAGIVVAPVPVERLVGMLAAADAGSQGAVSLRGENLELIARYPPEKGAGAAPAPDELRALVAAGEISGTFRAVSRVDGVERMYSYRRVANYPLHITVGRATSEYLGHFRRDMGMVAFLATGLLVVAILATAMIDRAWRRQARVAKLLETQAHTDSLTGLANRRRFFEMAEAELARARRYDAPLSMLMLDIDRFKEVNDTHGHRAGDRVLQSLARTCLGVLRNVDIVGRVGGEEFAILLPETGLEGARDVAERLRAAVERSSVARDEGVPLRITVSVGVAVLSEGANLDTLLSQSDAALYDAKHRGRNRVCAFGESA